MAKINSQLLFLTTSPRTPDKMIPEIGLLVKHFEGQVWDKATQRMFMSLLRDENFFQGDGANRPDFSARDRINRAPKSLGFVSLKPRIELTEAGRKLLTSKRTDEVFLRQLLKFQVPSPYHVPSDKAADFCVKPYLEILRLIRTLGTLSFDELQIFGMQLTDYHKFDEIIKRIERFRRAKVENTGTYRRFKTEYFDRELRRIYSDRINRGETKTRESNDVTLAKFLSTQTNNTRDYADACFRYLRTTGLVNVSHAGKSLSIVRERIPDVDYILENISREPVFVDDLEGYKSYLENADTPLLLTDNRELLLAKIHTEFPDYDISTTLTTDELKDVLNTKLEQRKQQLIRTQVSEIKDYRQYDDIQQVYERIRSKELYDAPLMLEWNTWRAMTMLDGGKITANLRFDDFGKPLSTAPGNSADIICDYGDFFVCVEVTMASGQRQYETEGEPVMRHLGKMQMASGKPCFCLFVSPSINDACVSYFYSLNHTNLRMYGGKLRILPMPLDFFRKMLEDSFKSSFVPESRHILKFFVSSAELADKCKDEVEWYENVKDMALHWLE